MRMDHGTQVRGSAGCGCIAGVTIQRWPDEAATYAGSSNRFAPADDVAGRILDLRPEVADALFHSTNRSRSGETQECPEEDILTGIKPEEAAAACRRLAAGEALDHIWRETNSAGKPRKKRTKEHR